MHSMKTDIAYIIITVVTCTFLAACVLYSEAKCLYFTIIIENVGRYVLILGEVQFL